MRSTRNLFFASVIAISLSLPHLFCTENPSTPSGGPYTLSTDVIPANSGTVTPADGSYNSGDAVTVTATAGKGYVFSHWTGASSSTDSAITIVMNGNRTLTANFELEGSGGGGVGIAAVTGDFWSSSGFQIVAAVADGYTASSNLINSLHTDLVVRAHGSDVYILERDGKDNVVKYDTKSGAVAYQQNLGAGINIQDIAIVSETKAYVSCYASAELIVFDPATGTKTSTIDLSRFNTYAGTDSAELYPFASSLAVYGDNVYIACQRMKTVQTDYGPTPEAAAVSVIAVVNWRTDEVVDSILLAKKNPGAISVFGGKMLVASSGNYYDNDLSGVELIDLVSGVSEGVIVDGTASNVLFISADKAYAGMMSATYSVEIVAIDLSTKAVGQPVSGIGDGFGGMVYDGTKVYIGDRGFESSGIAVVNPQTDEVEEVIATELPPTGLAVIK